MAIFFTAGLRVGETPNPDNAWLRQSFLEQCAQRIRHDDDLYLVGDLITGIDNLQFYDQLPDCRLHIFCGASECSIPNFEEEAYKRLHKHRNRLNVMTGVQYVNVGFTETWRIAHHSQELGGFACAMPSICGDGHSFWRARQLINGEPIINVDFEAWGGRLVTENMIYQEAHKIKSGEYATALDGAHFYDAHYQAQQNAMTRLQETTYGFLKTELMQAYIKRWGWNFIRAGVLVVNDNGEFLCVEEPRMKDKVTKQYIDVWDIWNLPAGSAKSPTESSKAAAVRRIKEETGYPIELTGLLFIKEKPDEMYPYSMPVYVGKVIGEPVNFDHQAIRSVAWKTEAEIEDLQAAEKLRSPDFMLEAIRCYTEGLILPLDVVVTR